MFKIFIFLHCNFIDLIVLIIVEKRKNTNEI